MCPLTQAPDVNVGPLALRNDIFGRTKMSFAPIPSILCGICSHLLARCWLDATFACTWPRGCKVGTVDAYIASEAREVPLGLLLQSFSGECHEPHSALSANPPS